MKGFLLVVLTLSTLCHIAYAQIPLTGKVYELHTQVTLPSVKVLNSTTHESTLTNASGIFNIKAKAGDMLILEAFAYARDTVVVLSARYIEVFLTPQNNNLKEVKVKDIATKTGSLTNPTFHNQTVRYQRDANDTPVGGIAIRFGYGKSGKEKKDEQRTYRENANQQIDNAFTALSVGKYIPLKGDDLKQFIALYRPIIKEFKRPDFDMILYVNDCYKKFMALSPDQRRLPQLKPDTTHN